MFTKDGQQLRCEIDCAQPDGHYRIVVTRPDRTRTTEDIERPTDLVERTAAVMSQLRDDGWTLG